MLIIVITAALMIVTAMLVGLGARRWSAFQLAPRLDPGQIRAEVHRHPRAAALARSRLDPNSATGLALTAALILLIAGVVAFGLLIWMVRTNIGFARFDLGAARFAAAHASPVSTRLLRDLSVLGGAVFLGPFAGLVCLAVVHRERLLAVIGFLLLTIGGQFAVVDLIKWIVDRTRPDIDRLTNFSGPSFPSGHAAAVGGQLRGLCLPHRNWPPTKGQGDACRHRGGARRWHRGQPGLPRSALVHRRAGGIGIRVDLVRPVFGRLRWSSAPLRCPGGAGLSGPSRPPAGPLDTGPDHTPTGNCRQRSGCGSEVAPLATARRLASGHRHPARRSPGTRGTAGNRD